MNYGQKERLKIERKEKLSHQMNGNNVRDADFHFRTMFNYSKIVAVVKN